MKVHRAFVVCAVAWVGAGCSLVAGLDDIDFVEPAEASAPTDPSPPPDPVRGDAGGSTPEGDSADAPVADAGPDEDASEDDAADDPLDAAPDARPVLFGCAEDDFAGHDGRPVGAARVIVFPAAADAGDAAPSYTPRCMRVAPGQSVTFEGPFTLYPLVPRRGAGNPIRRTLLGASATFVFPAAGTFGFVSPGRAGMRGAIDVRP